MSERRIETPFLELDQEERQVLYERHDRIKKELRSTLTIVIGASGTVITLSLTLFEKIAPHKLYPELLAASWVSFGLAALVALGVLMSMTMKSIKHQDNLLDLYGKGTLSLFRHHGGGTPGGNFLYVVTEKFPGEVGTRLAVGLCTIGVLCVAAFGVMNLVRT